MSGEGIVLAIRSLGIERVAQLKSDAHLQADQVTTAASTKQNESAEQYVNSRIEQAERDALRSEHSAAIANGRLLAEVKSEFLERVAQKAHEKLMGLRDTPEYAGLLRGLAIDALRDLGADAIIHVDERDVDMMVKSFAKESKRYALISVIGDIHTAGGVIAESADGKISCDNTFEARLLRENATKGKEIWEVLQQ